MKPFLIAILSALLSTIAPSVSAELPEFLVPVTGSDEAVALANNDFFVRRNTYFARRYRVVTVNVDLLRSADRFRISLFDNEFVVVEETGRKIMHGGLSVRWKGQIVEPKLPLSDLMADGVSQEEVEFAHSVITGLRIVATETSYDEATGTKYQYNFPRFEQYRTSGTTTDSDETAPMIGRAPFYDVGFTIEALLPNQVWLRPLETDPRYHLLIEIDPEKTFSRGSVDDIENPAQPEKRRQYRDFVRSLGQDPRPSDLHLE